MYCRNCGRELDDRAVICPHCGIQVGQMSNTPTNSGPANRTCDMAIIGFILSFFVSIAGLVCSIIAYRKCRDENLGGKGFAIAGIIISATSMGLALLYVIGIFSFLGCVLSYPPYYY